MADTFSYLSVLLYGTFAGALLVLQWHKPSKFVRRFALSWSIETVRNIIGLPEVRNLGGFISEWYGLHAALNFVAIWFLFSGCAALVGARLPRWLGPVYIGACIPLDIICRFIAPPYLARWLGWTAAEERSFMVAGTLAIQFVPLMATRAIILFWLCREWLSTRLPGALIAAFFCVPFTLFAFVVPLQVYFGYYPAWLSYFLLFRVFGFSIGIVMLLMGRQQRALEQSEQRLRAIIDHEPEGVIVLATDGLLSDMNPAGLRMIEADALDQLANQPMSALVVEEHRAAFHDFTGKILRGESGTLQFQVTGLKGSRRSARPARLRDRVTGNYARSD
jgi:PAS domain S-box-containing protein